MKTSRRSFLGILGGYVAAVATSKLPAPAEPEEALTFDDDFALAPFTQYDLNTNLGTLRVSSDPLNFPDDDPGCAFQFHDRNEWEPVKVVDHEVVKEVLSFYWSGKLDQELVSRFEGTITMRRWSGELFTVRFC
jgi:hypothetical protein